MQMGSFFVFIGTEVLFFCGSFLCGSLFSRCFLSGSSLFCYGLLSGCFLNGSFFCSGLFGRCFLYRSSLFYYRSFFCSGSLNLSGSLLLGRCLGLRVVDDGEVYGGGYLLVELNTSGVAANGLYFAYDDLLSVNLYASGSKTFGNLNIGYRAVDGASGADLHGDYECRHGIDLGCQGLSLFLNLGQLMSLLAEILSQYFLGALGGICGLACRNEFGVGVAVLVFFDSVLLFYFIISVTKGSSARWRARLTACATRR